MSAVSNSSPLIALEKIGQLGLMRALFSPVIIPPAVARETAPTVALPPWITVQPLTRPLEPKTMRPTFGPGEREAISLSLEIRATRTILDDEPARRLARQLGLSVIGTLGILLAAKRKGLLNAIRPHLDDLLRTNFFIGPELYERLLLVAGE